MFYNICYYYMIFFVFSLIGYIVEVFFCFLQEKRVIFSRGFLIGPYIPIYGIGTVLIILFLSKYYDDPLAFFCLTVILCSIVEYLTSYIMEKIFKVRWWDYSKERFNLNGRVCLSNSILFGFGGVVILYLLMPNIHKLFFIIPNTLFYIISIVCFIIFVVDFIITTCALFNVKSTLLKFEGMDVTEIAKEKIIKEISKHEFNFSRIFDAFPRIGIINDERVEDFRILVLNVRKAVKENRRKRKERRKKRIEKIEKVFDNIKK